MSIFRKWSSETIKTCQKKLFFKAYWDSFLTRRKFSTHFLNTLRLLKFNDVDKNVDLWDSKSRTWEKTFEVGKTQLQRFVVSKNLQAPVQQIQSSPYIYFEQIPLAWHIGSFFASIWKAFAFHFSENRNASKFQQSRLESSITVFENIWSNNKLYVQIN